MENIPKLLALITFGLIIRMFLVCNETNDKYIRKVNILVYNNIYTSCSKNYLYNNKTYLYMNKKEQVISAITNLHTGLLNSLLDKHTYINVSKVMFLRNTLTKTLSEQN